jgi:hypothetical protein
MLVVETPTTLPTETPSPIPSLIFTSTPTPSVLFTLDAIRMAYVVDGNLYVQDGSNQPIQLTHSGEDSAPIFSDDGRNIVFFRGQIPYDLYAINADGNGELALLTSSQLVALNLGYSDITEIRSLAFVPGTHQLLFNAHEFKPSDIVLENMNYLGAKPNLDLLLVDTDTAEIKRLLPPGEGGPFQVSPDGKMVGIQTINHIDVIGLDGKIIRRNLATYPSAWVHLWTSNISWTQDSSKLNVIFPISIGSVLDSTGPEPRTIWQYSINGNLATVQIHLAPSPIGDSFNISPDGNWIIYTYYYYPGKTDEMVTTGIYLGNLRDGGSQLIEGAELYGLPQSFEWSPDNIHFIFEDRIQPQLYLGNINGETTPLHRGQFLGWIDASHYLFGNGRIGEIGKEESLNLVNMPIPQSNAEPFTFIFLKHKTKEEK